MNYLYAILPIISILFFMIKLKWPGHKAGPVSLLISILIAWLFFGLNIQVLWVSQIKGLLLSIYVLLVIWPAIFLYNFTKQLGGIASLSELLGALLKNKNLLVVLLAWSFSGLLEGVAGFGVPIAVVSPMLVGLGVEPISAVAAVAIGHAWSITFGDMGIIMQTLSGVIKIESNLLVPFSSLLLGITCIFCGLASAWVLGQIKLWRQILLIGIGMSVVQFGMGKSGLIPLAALVAGLTGILLALLINYKGLNLGSIQSVKNLNIIYSSYGVLIILMSFIYLTKPVFSLLSKINWFIPLPRTETALGFITQAGSSQVFRFLVHPGTIMMLTIISAYILFRARGIANSNQLSTSLKETWKSAAPASFGILTTVGLSAILDQTGMTHLLAKGLSQYMGVAFPIVSPMIGILGAFATGSNNNSNILFGPMQKNIAEMLSLNTNMIIAAQTTGGSIGSMLAPAKIIVGCSTVGLEGKEGDVLRKTLGFGLAAGIIVGLFVFIFLLFGK